MSNLLDKASIILTPTAYNNGEALCVKPSDGSGDFDFSRNSAATRVNAQGLVENVQILSSNLVQNGDFSEEGVQEVSNGSFSQEGAQLVTGTNSDMSGANSWVAAIGSLDFNINTTVQNRMWCNFTTGNQQVILPNTIEAGKSYLVSLTAKLNSGTATSVMIGGFTSNQTSDTVFNITPTSTTITYSGYINSDTNTSLSIGIIAANNNGSDFEFDNVSCVEVGQNWTLGTGWSIGEDKIISNASGLLQQSTSELTVGKTYKTSFEITEYTSGGVKLYSGSGSDTPSYQTSLGTHVVYFVANGNTTSLYSNNFIGSITNISVKEVGQNWSLETGWSIGDDVATCDGTNAVSIQQPLATVNTKLKKITFTVSNYVSGQLRVYSGAGADVLYTVTANGTYTYYDYLIFNKIFFYSASLFNGSITNISVIEISTDTNLPRINYEGFSYQDALGSELVTNGSFDSDTAWNKNGTITISGGTANFNNSASGNNVEQAVTLPSGKQYIATYEITSITEGKFSIYVGGVLSGNQNNQVGVYTEVFTSIGNNVVYVRARGTTTGSIDNVSVKEYLGQEVVPDSGCGSWLWESQSTNLITQSELFSDSSWTKVEASVTSGFSSPDGLTNAYKLIASVNNSNHRIRSAIIPTAAVGTTVTFSIYIKPQEITKIALVDNWTNLSYGVVNLTTNSVIEEAQGTTSVTEILNGFRRVSFTYQTANINTLPAVYLLDDGYTSGNPTSYTFASDGTSGVYIWGAMLEQNSFSTSYIPTEGSTVTRNQDVCTNGGSLASINSTEGVLYAEIASENITTFKNISINNGGVTNRINLYIYSSSIVVNFDVGGVNQASLSYSIPNVTIFNKFAFSYKLNEFKLFVNGVQRAIDTSGAVPAVGTFNKLSFNDGALSKFFGKTKCLAVWKEALSDSELQSLTTI